MFFNSKKTKVEDYEEILNSKKIILIDEIKEQILTKKLLKNKNFLNNIFFLKEYNLNFDKIYRQFLYTDLAYYKLNPSLISGLNQKSSNYVLPKEWLKVLDDFNIPKNILASKMLWLIYLFKKFILFQAYFFKNIILFFIPGNKLFFNSIFFYQLPKINLNKIKNNDESFVINHFIKKFNSENKADFCIYHNNQNYPDIINYKGIKILKKTNFIRIYKIKNLLKLIIFWIYYNINLVVFFFTRPEICVLSKEILESYIFYLEKKNYSKNYLFNNSMPLYKPIWTYIKKKDCKIFLFFYAMSCNPVKFELNQGTMFDLFFRSNHFGWRELSWSSYIFWNDYQYDYFKKILKYKDFESIIEKPLHWGGLDLYLNRKKTLCFFDIPPFSKSFSVKRHPPTFYNFKNLKKTFNDILFLCNKYNFQLIYKVKRYNDKIHDPEYLKFINSIKNENNVIVADDKYSPEAIIKNSDLCICYPFTASAVISRKFDVKSVYYDISNLNYNSNLAYGNIPIYKNLNDLDKWISVEEKLYEK